MHGGEGDRDTAGGRPAVSERSGTPIGRPERESLRIIQVRVGDGRAGGGGGERERERERERNSPRDWESVPQLCICTMLGPRPSRHVERANRRCSCRLVPSRPSRGSCVASPRRGPTSPHRAPLGRQGGLTPRRPRPPASQPAHNFCQMRSCGEETWLLGPTWCWLGQAGWGRRLLPSIVIKHASV